MNILPNFRAQGSFGSAPPAFKEGDRAWTGAAIAEIPDLSNMRIDLKLEEVDRGKMKLGRKCEFVWTRSRTANSPRHSTGSARSLRSTSAAWA